MLSRFDEGPDLVLYYKHLMVLSGHDEYRHHINADDSLSDSQREFAGAQLALFRRWWQGWPGRAFAVAA